MISIRRSPSFICLRSTEFGSFHSIYILYISYIYPIYILAQFGKFSGYKINLEKSEIFPLNQSATSIPPSHFPFRIVNKGFKYLVVEITPAFLSLFTKDFNILFENFLKYYARWMNLPLSAGRINLVKMAVLRTFLYLFQNIPILIKKSFFSSLQGCISWFIWNGKPPRIKRSALQRPKKLAGLAVPNFIYYYWACNIKTMLHWIGWDRLSGCESWVPLAHLI